MYSRASRTITSSAAPVTLIRSGDPVTRKLTLAAGAVYAVGSVLGVNSTSGKASLSAAAATDGSQEPAFVLPYTVDASAGDVEAITYERADLVASALVLGAGHTLASIRAGLRNKGITFG